MSAPGHMWDLRSPTRDWTCAPCIGRRSLNHWTTREKYESQSVSCSVMSDSLGPHGPQPARLLCPWDSPGKNSGVGCHALLQGIFPTQGSNLGLLHCQADSLSAEPQGKPKNTGVGSLSLLQQIFLTQESNWVSWTAGGFFTYWAIREASKRQVFFFFFLNQKCLDTCTFRVFYSSYQKDTTYQDFTFSLQGMWVSSLIRELTSHVLRQKKPFI